MTINRRRIITWQPVLTDHQAYTYEALQLFSKATIVAYVCQIEDSTRRAQGWLDTNVQSIQRLLIPRLGLLFCIKAIYSNRREVHLFASVFGDWRTIFCLLTAVLLKVEFYLISEPYSTIADGYFDNDKKLSNRIKAVMRPILYKMYGFFIRWSVNGVFAISRLAVQQYETIGISSHKIFPFGYFVPRADNRSYIESTLETSIIRIVFVGSLIPRKGLSLLTGAVQLLTNENLSISLDVYGPGSFDCADISENSIRYRGLIPFGEAEEFIKDYDVLVLPSLYDGWGVVVNEALNAGVPVICSDNVGAAELVRKFHCGLVFDAGESADLARKLRRFCSEGGLRESMRNNCSLASDAIQPAKAAQYMHEIMQATKESKSDIQSPWYEYK
jgi:glycosyltransferase involved in cell wall biosynthesis